MTSRTLRLVVGFDFAAKFVLTVFSGAVFINRETTREANESEGGYKYDFHVITLSAFKRVST